MIEALLPLPDTTAELMKFKATFQIGHLDENQGSQKSLGAYLDANASVAKHWKISTRLLTSAALSEKNSDTMHVGNYLLSPSGESYSLVNLAYLSYENKGFSMSAGRILVDTPFADSDDFRMAINTFEGMQAKYKQDDFDIHLLALSAMSGIDAPNIECFSPLAVHSSGLFALGFEQELNNHDIALWNYHVDAVMDNYYLRYRYHRKLDVDSTIKTTLAFNAQKPYENSGINGYVVSTDLLLEYGTYRFFTVYDGLKVKQNSIISDGYGAGPFMSAADLTSLGVASSFYPGHDINAYKVLLGKKFTSDVSVEYGYTYYQIQNANKDLFENNVVIDWSMYKNFDLHIVGTVGEHKDRSMNLIFLRVRYSL